MTTPRTYADPRAVFLARAAAREVLYRAGELDLDEAVDGLLDALEMLRPCACHRDLIERLSAPAPKAKRRRATA
jgi:hypothetical protein